MILHVLIAMVASWLQRHQQQTIASLLEENRVLKTHLGGRRRFTDTERRRLAVLAYPARSQASEGTRHACDARDPLALIAPPHRPEV